MLSRWPGDLCLRCSDWAKFLSRDHAQLPGPLENAPPVKQPQRRHNDEQCSLIIVKIEIGFETLSGFSHGFISLQIDFFILDAFACSFNNDEWSRLVLHPSSLMRSLSHACHLTAPRSMVSLPEKGGNEAETFVKSVITHASNVQLCSQENMLLTKSLIFCAIPPMEFTLLNLCSTCISAKSSKMSSPIFIFL